MASDILLSNNSKELLADLANDSPHAILLIAPDGSGKKFFAKHLAEALLSSKISSLASAHYLEISPEKNIISIEQARTLKQFMALRVPYIASGHIKRVAVIQQAELMTVEAQNSILKVLEEPPLDTVIVLTASSPNKILPTILSRLRQLKVQLPRKQKIVEHFLELGYDDKSINKMMMISGNRVGLLSQMLSSDDHHLVQSIENAKNVLKMPKFQRLVYINSIYKDKEKTINLIKAIQIIATTAMRMNSGSQIKRWHNLLKKTLFSEEMIGKNAQPKLVLLDLFSSM